MFAWVRAVYARRIVNVNVNIVVAGVLALGPTMLAVHFSRYLGVADTDKRAIGLITFVADVVSDVIIYYVLHWFANHSPRAARRALERMEKVVMQGTLVNEERLIRGEGLRASFFADATRVQIERMCLAPLLYLLWLGGQQVLMYEGLSREWATLAGFAAGIAATRTLHTFWMLYQERRQAARLALALAGNTPGPAPDPAPSRPATTGDTGAPAGQSPASTPAATSTPRPAPSGVAR